MLRTISEYGRGSSYFKCLNNEREVNLYNVDSFFNAVGTHQPIGNSVGIPRSALLLSQIPM